MKISIRNKIERLIALQLMYTQLNGNTYEYQSMQLVTQDITYVPKERFGEIYRYLINEKLVVQHGTGYYCRMTQKGIDLIENQENLSDKELILDFLGYVEIDKFQYSTSAIYKLIGITSIQRIIYLTNTMKEKRWVKSVNGGSQFDVMVTYEGSILTSEDFDNVFSPEKKQVVQNITHSKTINNYTEKKDAQLTVFKMEKLPYLLIGLLSFIGLLASNIYNQLNGENIIEYQFEIKNLKIKNNVTYTEYEYVFSNISKVIIDTININFTLKPDTVNIIDGFTRHELEPISPTSLQNHYIKNLRMITLIKLWKFYPSFKYRYHLATQTTILNNKPILSFTPITNGIGIQVIEKNFQTWLIRNNLTMSIILLTILLLSAFLYLSNLNKVKTKKEDK